MDISLNLTDSNGEARNNAVLRLAQPLTQISLQYQIYPSADKASEGTKPGVIGYQEVEHIVDFSQLAALIAKGARELSREEVPGPREGDEPLVHVLVAIAADKIDSVWDGAQHVPVDKAEHAITGPVPSGKTKGRPIEEATLQITDPDLLAAINALILDWVPANLATLPDPLAEEWEKDKKLAERFEVAPVKKAAKK